jgi:GntR family transcriptional regulator
MPPALPYRVLPASGAPIYRQIMDQVRARIAGGALKLGQSLPSVRVMAAHLEVNPMTVSKAYSLLDREGVLRRARGQGMLVAPHDPRGSVRQRQDQLKPHIQQMAAMARHLGLTQVQTQKMIDAAMKEYFQHESTHTGT